MYRGKIPHKWSHERCDLAYDFPAPHVEAAGEFFDSAFGDLPPQAEQLNTEPATRPEPGARAAVAQNKLEQEECPMSEQSAPPENSEAAPRRAETALPPSGLISGRNAVLEALRSGQTVNRVWLAEGLGGSFVTEVIKRCRECGAPYQFLPKAKLTSLAGPDHRGVACELAPFNYAEPEEMLALAASRGEPPLLLLLDGVEDPHNLGAIIRTALCVGAHGVIIPKRRAAAMTATVAKTSAGASAYLPVARVSNLNQTARRLKEAGLWLAAADMDGKTAWQADLRGPLALALGGEGGGVSPLLKRQCDFIVSLPMTGPLGSLNVSAAASAMLYEIRRQRTN